MTLFAEVFSLDTCSQEDGAFYSPVRRSSVTRRTVSVSVRPAIADTRARMGAVYISGMYLPAQSTDIN